MDILSAHTEAHLVPIVIALRCLTMVHYELIPGMNYILAHLFEGKQSKKKSAIKTTLEE